MRFTAAATLLTMATTAMAASWRIIGDDLAIAGPSQNATFKAGDTIPFEYAFFKIKSLPNANTTQPVNGTTVSATVSSISWVGETGNQTLSVTFDNERNNGVQCLQTDICQGTYYPKRINLVIPENVFPDNYTIVLGYSLSMASLANRVISYKTPVNIVDKSAEIPPAVGVFGSAPAVSVTLPVYDPPKSSGLMNKVPKAVVGMTIMIASAMLML
ncbi:hypothetical protein BGZ76_008310 [Entomortierella beljakovae]|nr:hypothetical protein BGZ76_008310 [Entomortierella beljakovae]